MESSQLSELQSVHVKSQAKQTGYWEVLLGENKDKAVDDQDEHNNLNTEEAKKSRNTVEIIDLGSGSEEDETETQVEKDSHPNINESRNIYHEQSANVAHNASDARIDEENENGENVTFEMQIENTNTHIQPAQNTYTYLEQTEASTATDSFNPLSNLLDQGDAVNSATEVTISETIDDITQLKGDASIFGSIMAQSDNHIQDQNEILRSIDMSDQSNVTGRESNLLETNGPGKKNSNEQYAVMPKDQNDSNSRESMTLQNQRDDQELDKEQSHNRQVESSLEPWHSSSPSVEVLDLSQPDPSSLSQYRGSTNKSVNLSDTVDTHEKFFSSSQQRTVVPDSEDSLDSERSIVESEIGNLDDPSPPSRVLSGPVLSDTHSERNFTTHRDHRFVSNSSRQYPHISLEESTTMTTSAHDRWLSEQSGKAMLVKDTQFEASVNRLDIATNSKDDHIITSNAKIRDSEVQSPSYQQLYPDSTNAQTSVTEGEENANILSGKNDEKHADLSLPEYPTTQALLASSFPTEHTNMMSSENAKKKITDGLTQDDTSNANGKNSVPKVLSQWFAPRKSDIFNENNNEKLNASEHNNGVEMTDESTKKGDLSTREEESTHPQSPPMITKSSQSTQISGLRTPFSYYHPLVTIDAYLNSQSEAIDTISVASRDSKAPTRAASGPKDYYTIFRITDPSVWPIDTLVQVFRPWRKALPSVRKGDVVMLRSMRLKSRKRRPYLISCDESAWCVWKGDSREPECAGPPVDKGTDEEKAVNVLRSWWANEAERQSESTRSEEG